MEGLPPFESVTQIGHLESFIDRDARGQWTIDEVSIGMRSAGDARRVGAATVVSVSGIQIGEGGALCVVA